MICHGLACYKLFFLWQERLPQMCALAKKALSSCQELEHAMK